MAALLKTHTHARAHTSSSAPSVHLKTVIKHFILNVTICVCRHCACAWNAARSFGSVGHCGSDLISSA